MIVFAAIAPHSPLLLPTIGKEHQKNLTKTLTAYTALEEDCYAAKPDVLVVLSPHRPKLANAFSLGVSYTYRANLKEFGDFTTELNFKNDPALVEKIRALRYGEKPLPLALNGEETLDYGTIVPLYFLTKHLQNTKVVALGDSQLNLKNHWEAGQAIGEILQQVTQRIALVASADLAHTLTDAAPGGFSPAGKEFDEAVVQTIRRNESAKILKMEAEAGRAKACGLRVLAIFLGILESMNCTPELLSYEGPFGVGYLAVRYKIA